jgi:hypothetical protein
MRVEYKNPEILKRPDSRIILKGLQGIWEPDTKTLRLYYEGRIVNMPREIYSTDGDYIMELILDSSDSDSGLGNCGNIIYIEFPEDTMADISTSGLPSNITYLESRGYAIGENILRGINTTIESRVKKFISKSSWYRYFRINRKTKAANLKRLDWAGRSVSKDYYERNYSDLYLFCDGVDEESGTVYGFKMATPCITFYGFATEETYKVEGNNRKLISREIVSLENVPGLVISELPGGTRNFVLSIDSEHLRAELLTITNFDPETSDIIYHAEFIAEVYDSIGQRNTSYPLEITTLSEDLTWHWDTERTTTMFREDGCPVFLFRYDDCNRGVYHTLRISSIRAIDNIEEVTIKVGSESPDDPYFTYEISLGSNASGGSDIIVKISPRPGLPNLTEYWIPRLYADVPEPRQVVYKHSKLTFYAIIGPKNDDLYIVDPEDTENTEIDVLEFPNDILGGNYLVKTTGNDTYWRGLATHSKVYATSYGYTGLVEQNINTDDPDIDTPVVIPDQPKQTIFKFDKPGSDTSGIMGNGLWIFPSSCSVRPGQVFTMSSAEVKGSGYIWCRESCIGDTSRTNNFDHSVVTAGGSSKSYAPRGGSRGSGSGSGSRQVGETDTSKPVVTNSIRVNNCYYFNNFIAPDTPGTYVIDIYGVKDKSKYGTFKVKVESADEGKYYSLSPNAYMVPFRTDHREPGFSDGTDVEKSYYQTSYFLLKVWAIYNSNKSEQVLITDFGSPNCDFTWKITKSGIIDHIEGTEQGLKIFRGSNHGVTELIIYCKSDPSVYLDIPVIFFGGQYKYYQSSLK